MSETISGGVIQTQRRFSKALCAAQIGTPLFSIFPRYNLEGTKIMMGVLSRRGLRINFSMLCILVVSGLGLNAEQPGIGFSVGEEVTSGYPLPSVTTESQVSTNEFLALLSSIKPLDSFFIPAVTGSLSPSNPTVGVTQVSIVGTASPNATVTANPEVWPDGTVHGPFQTQANSSGSYSMGPFVLQQLGTYSSTLRDSINGSQTTINYSGSGDFSVSRSPSSRTITAGESASFTVTFTSVSGFAGTVNPSALNWGNIPNATATWAPAQISVPSGGSSQSTFRIQTAANTTPGTYGNIILRGTNGSVTRSASAATVTVNAPTVNLTAALCPSSPTVGVTNVSICGTGTPGATITDNPSIWPDNTSHGPFTAVVNGSGNYTMGPFILQQLGQYTDTLRDSISGQQIQFPYSGQGNFTASVNTTSRTVTAGQSASYTVTFTSQSGFAGTVIPAALNWSQVPNATASWSPTQVSVPSGGSAQSTFTIQTAANTTSGTYNSITLQGANGSQTRTAPNVSLTVNPPTPTLTAALCPSNPIVGVTNVSICGTATPNSTVTDNPDVWPDGTVHGPFQTQANSSGNYSMGPFVLQQLGQYSGTLRDSISGQQIPFMYQGQGDFGASVNTTSRSILRGQQATYTVTFSSVGGFAGTVNPSALNWSSVPGTTAWWSPSQVSVPSGGSAQSTFTIQTSGATTSGTYTGINLRGQNGSFVRSSSPVSLNVSISNAAPNIASVSPSPVSYNQATNLTVNGSNFRPGFNAFVTTPNGTFQIAQAGLTFVSNAQVRVQVLMLGAPPYTATLKIANDDGQFDTEAFQVAGAGLPAPSISNITPNPVTVGTPTWLTVTGNNFVNEPEIKVSWPNCGGSCPATIAPEAVLFDSSNQVRVQVNMGGTPPYQATIHLKNPDQQGTTQQFAVGGSTATLELFGLEVTQGVQNLANQVELVRMKPTWVRAHVRLIQSLTGDVIANARLVGRRLDGSPLPGSPLSPINAGQGLNTGSIRVGSNPQRTARNDSFLFSLPAEWTTGTVDLKFEGISHNFVYNEPDGTHDGLVRTTFNDTPDLRIRLVKVYWGGVEPTDQEIARVAADLRIMLPAQFIDFKYSRLESPLPPAYTPDYFQWLNLELLRKRRTECVGISPGCDDLYLGVISPRSVSGPVTGTLGAAIGTASYPCSPDYKGIVSSAYFLPVDHVARFGYVHEVGHNLGRFHTAHELNSPIPEQVCQHPFGGTIGGASSSQYSPFVAWGFNGQYVFPSLTPDVMSYAPNKFISRHTYENILQHIRSRFTLNRSIDKSDLMIQQGEDSLLISGRIGLNQQAGSLSPIFKLPSPTGIPANGMGTSRIVFYDSNNNELADYPFEPEFGSEGDTGLFGLLLPPHPNATRISLVRAGQVLDSKLASPNLPTVTVNSPNGGEVLTGDSAAIDWTASDLDGDSLTYLVQFSPDNGKTWTTLATNWTETSFSIDLRSIVGTNQGLIRVLASDGFHTGRDQSNAVFTVIGRGPTVNVFTPNDNAGYVGDQPVVLQGNATDLEDGELSGTALKWISNLDGQLGTGSSLTVNAMDLTEGTHRISLSAQDSDGYITTSTVTVRIFRSRPVLPASLSLAPSQLSFVAVAGTGLTAPQVVAVRNDGDGDLGWSASADQSWIHIGTTSGTAPSNPEIRVNRNGLTVGNYTGILTVMTPNAANSPQTVNVSLTIVEPGNINISGRAFGRTNRGLNLGVVTLTDSIGNVRYASTNPFGYFRFLNVPRGEVYSIRVRTKGNLTYQPVVIQPFENINSLTIGPDP